MLYVYKTNERTANFVHRKRSSSQQTEPEPKWRFIGQFKAHEFGSAALKTPTVGDLANPNPNPLIRSDQISGSSPRDE